MTPERVALGAVAIHLVAHAAHGVVHERVPVGIADWQTAYVVVAVFAVPLLGAAALAWDRPRVGAWLVLVAGAGSLVFEVAFHFVLDNPDHVEAVAAGSTASEAAVSSSAAFTATAVLAAATALVLLAAGVWVLLAHSHGGSPRSAMESRT